MPRVANTADEACSTACAWSTAQEPFDGPTQLRYLRCLVQLGALATTSRDQLAACLSRVLSGMRAIDELSEAIAFANRQNVYIRQRLLGGQEPFLNGTGDWHTTLAFAPAADHVPFWRQVPTPPASPLPIKGWENFPYTSVKQYKAVQSVVGVCRLHEGELRAWTGFRKWLRVGFAVLFGIAAPGFHRWLHRVFFS